MCIRVGIHHAISMLVTVEYIYYYYYYSYEIIINFQPQFDKFLLFLSFRVMGYDQ